jgi:hypothetical protein
MPFVCSIVASIVLSRWLPTADQWWLGVLRFCLIASLSTLAMFGVYVVGQRFLPLARLLDLTLIFPDNVPSRFRVALRRSGTARLRREAQANGPQRNAADEMFALLEALGRHDRMTKGHTERVRAYSELIGKEMGLDDDELDRLRWGAMLHDIGKLHVPTEVLNKPSRLDDIEYAIIRGHPTAGEGISQHLADFLGPALNAVWEHHEKWDGSGYPRGLKGEQITLAGRIVAVADAFDVMTSSRSYHKPESAAAAREELARCAGTHFDPAVVRAFMTVSVGSLRWAMGPASWLTQLAVVPRAITGRPAVATAAAGVVGLVASGLGLAVGGDDPAPSAAAATITAVPAPSDGGSDGGSAGGGSGGGGPGGGGSSVPPTPPPPPAQPTLPPVQPATSSPPPVSPRVPTPTPPPASSPTSTPRTSSPRQTTTTGPAPPATRPRVTTTTLPGMSTTLPRTSTTLPGTSSTTTSTTVTTPPSGSSTSTSTSTTVAGSPVATFRLVSTAPGDVTSADPLPMSTGGAAANSGAVPNFDTDRNADPGLTLAEGESQRFELQPDSPLRFDGVATVWLGMGDAGLDGDQVVVDVELLECLSSGNCRVVGRAVVTSQGTGFRMVAFDFGVIRETIPVSRTFVVLITVQAGDAWLVYDHVEYPSRVVAEVR